MGADKGGDGLPMALEAEAVGQFIGHQLEVGGGFCNGTKSLRN